MKNIMKILSRTVLIAALGIIFSFIAQTDVKAYTVTVNTYPSNLYADFITKVNPGLDGLSSGTTVTIVLKSEVPTPNYGNLPYEGVVISGGYCKEGVRGRRIEFTITGDVTVTVYYKKLDISVNKDQHVDSASADPTQAIEGDTVTLTATVTDPNYEFDKWTTDDENLVFANANNASTTFIMPDHAVSVTAESKPRRNHTITFDPNGGSVGDSTDSFTMTTGMDGKLSSLPEPSREGYSFAGWFDETTSTTTAVTLDREYNINITLIAYWVEDHHTITYKVKNGKWNDDSTDNKSETVTHEGYLMQIPDVGDKPSQGFMAGRWTPLPPNMNEAVTHDMEYTYTYSRMPTVTVNDDGHGSAQADPTSGVTGTSVTIIAIPDNSYQFKKWIVEHGDISLADPAKATTTFDIGTEDVEVKATFTKKTEPTPGPEPTPSKISIKNAAVKLSKTSFKYNGKVQTPSVTVKLNGKTLSDRNDYSVSWSDSKSKKPDKYTVTITGKGKYKGSKTVKYEIVKAKNPLTLKLVKKSLNVPYSKLKKGNRTIKLSTCLKVSKAQGKVTYSKSKGNKKITIDKKTGKITVGKGLKKGTYKVTISVKAAGNKNYKSLTQKATVKIVVK